MTAATYVMLRSGGIHMTEDALIAHTAHAHTLCGRPIDESSVFGDETRSGIAATCKTCKRVLRGVTT